MKISKRKKIILLIVSLFYLVVILLNWLSESIDAIFVENLLTTITLLSGFFTFAYNFLDIVFLKTNKCLRIFHRDTVAWKSQYKFYISPEVNFEELNYKFIKKISDSGYEVTKLKNSKSSCTFTLTKGGYDRIFDINPDYFEDYTQIRILYSSSTSYKDSKNEIDKFFNALEIYTKGVKEIDVSDPVELKSQYSASVSFEKNNPFYKLVIRHTDDTADVLFNLKFKEGNAQINIEKNKLSVVTPYKKEIIKVLNEYLILSSID